MEFIVVDELVDAVFSDLLHLQAKCLAPILTARNHGQKWQNGFPVEATLIETVFQLALNAGAVLEQPFLIFLFPQRHKIGSFAIKQAHGFHHDFPIVLEERQ